MYFDTDTKVMFSAISLLRTISTHIEINVTYTGEGDKPWLVKAKSPIDGGAMIGSGSTLYEALLDSLDWMLDDFKDCRK